MPVEAKKTEFRFLLATLFIFGFLSFLVFRPFLYYIVGGVLMVFAFWPAHRKIKTWVKKPGVAAFFTFLLVGITLVGPLVAVGFLVFNDAVSFAKSYDPNELNETIQPYLDRFGIAEGEVDDNGTSRPSEAANFLGEKIKSVAEGLGEAMIEALPHLALGLFVAGFVVYYGFLDGETFYHQLRHVLPLPEPIEDSLFHQLRDVTRAVFVGSIFVALLSAVLGTATFLIFGVPNAVFWGFIMIILGVLPLVGAPFIWGPMGLWMLINGDTTSGLSILVINFIGGFGYIEHVLRPRLIGQLGRVHPVWILLGVMGGIEVFGILGFVIGPLVLAVFIAILRSYTEFHPRWQGRRDAGQAPFSSKGRVRPQPFADEPRHDREVADVGPQPGPGESEPEKKSDEAPERP